LNADCVSDLAHDAAQGVDFANQVSLGDTANGWIAGHLRDEVDVQCVERGVQPHARGRPGGFTARVPCTDYDYIELFRELHAG
jgi:hypothetical protein